MIHKRVVVVDDNEVYRTGMEEILREHDDIEVVAALGHDAALERSCEWWDGVEVALVDLADVREQVGDQFPGVHVIEAIRRCRTSNQTLVVAYTFHVMSGAARRRAREAQADFFYDREELSPRDVLYQVVLRPDEARRGVPPPVDPAELDELGITLATDLNAALDPDRWAELQAAKRKGPREKIRARTAYNKVARLEVRNRDGSTPGREQRVPGWYQLERVWEWGTRVFGRADR